MTEPEPQPYVPEPFEYVALAPITTPDGTLAYNAGDFVHRDNVERNGYEVGVQVALREQPAEVEEAPYDPASDTVEGVNAALDEHPEWAAQVLAAEREGKGRAGILHGPHGSPPNVAEV